MDGWLQVQVSPVSRKSRSALRDGIVLLSKRCDAIGACVVEMDDDGNCQFRALAHELYGDQAHHGHVRRRVIARLRAREPEYRPYVGDGVKWLMYLERMARSCCWGDEVTLRAAAEAYSCVVHVLTSEAENWLLHYGAEQASEHSRECFLSYVSPIHYNVVALPVDNLRKNIALS
jgi:hypothetical protein